MFVGSVFSPHYAAARAKTISDPWRHVAINVALCGPLTNGWAFAEGALAPHERHSDAMRLGRSRVRRDEDGAWEIDVHTPRTAFDPAVQGRIVLRPSHQAPPAPPRALDAAGGHAWWPVCPNARVEVSFAAPACRWQGRAYHDTNWGGEPIEKAFARWQWMRTLGASHTEVAYATQRADGTAHHFAHRYHADGRHAPTPLGAAHALPRTHWRLPRTAFGEARLDKTLLDAPFYARSRLLNGQNEPSMHESLDLSRWRHPVTQRLLRFRLRRL